jgi:hypothetical protein
MTVNEQLDKIATNVKAILKPHLLAGSRFCVTVEGKRSRICIISERIFKDGRIEGEVKSVLK